MKSINRFITRIQDADDANLTLTNGYMMVYDSGQGKFVMQAIPSTSPGGSSGQVQYHNGSGFAGHGGFTYDGAGKATLSSALVVPTLSNVSGAREYHRNVASYVSSSFPETGTMKITMPKKASSSHVSITIRGYNYDANLSADWELFITFYNFLDGGFYGASAELRGTAAPFSSVRFGSDATNDVILLGTTSTSWAIPRIDITDLSVSGSNITGWATGWSIARITSETGITITKTPTITYAGQVIFPSIVTSVPASTDTTFNSLYQKSAGHYARWGLVDPGSGLLYRGMYLQGGFTGSVLYYNIFLNPLGGNVAVGIPPATLSTALLDVAASGTSRSSLRIRSGTAPTSPNDGDVWFDGTDFYLRSANNYSVGSVVRTTAIRPVSDGTSAVKFYKAGSNLAIVIIDTTNECVAIGRNPPVSSYKLDVDGNVTFRTFPNAIQVVFDQLDSATARWFPTSKLAFQSNANSGVLVRATNQAGDSGSAKTIFQIDSGSSALSTAGSKLLVVKNTGSDCFSIDRDGKISTNQSVANTNTPSGATTKALPLYNESGTLLGYVPIYASQW